MAIISLGSRLMAGSGVFAKKVNATSPFAPNTATSIWAKAVVQRIANNNDNVNFFIIDSPNYIFSAPCIVFFGI